MRLKSTQVLEGYLYTQLSTKKLNTIVWYSFFFSLKNLFWVFFLATVIGPRMPPTLELSLTTLLYYNFM